MGYTIECYDWAHILFYTAKTTHSWNCSVVFGTWNSCLCCDRYLWWIFFFRFQFKVEHFKLFEIFELFFLFSAHFVLFYFVLIMSYRSIKLYGRRTERDFDWKIVSIAIGFLELALSIGITTFFIYLSICFEAPIVLLVTCLIFGEMEFFFIDFLKKGWTLSSNKTTEILTFFTFLQFLI